MRPRAKPTKPKVKAKLPVSRKAPKTEGSRVRDLEKRLAEALEREAEALKRESQAHEQQAATVEILRLISSSPTALQPVMDAVAATAARLCGATDAIIRLVEGGTLRIAAQFGYLSTPDAIRPIGRDYPAGLSVIERRTIHIHDVLALLETEFPRVSRVSRELRTVLTTPLLRGGVPIGVFVIRRTEVQPFTASQIRLLQTFADQAVIAIENVRLFNETKEALERQTGTSEILRVIAGSPTDLQPVFDAILKRAATLCEAQLAHLWLYEGGEQFRVGAGYGSRPDHLQWLQQGLHRIGPPFFRESGPWRVGQVLDVRDTEPYRRGEPLWIQTADHEGMRTLLGVPLVKDGRLVGSIAVYRREVQPFTDQQTALVQTFADQAVIAIENVRLFEELEARNRDVTATAEILQVISRSPTDAQPVFDTIAERAVTLCSAAFGAVFRFNDGWLNIVALSGMRLEEAEAAQGHFPRRLTPAGPGLSRVAVTGELVHIPDVQADPEWRATAAGPAFSAAGFRTCLIVPLNREGLCLGAINVWRREAAPFSESQIALLQTFADQAVIAIENVRLFTELKARTLDLTRSVDELTALGDVSRTLSSTLDLETVLQMIVTRAVQIAGTAGCNIWEYDEPRAEFRLRASHYADQADATLLQAPGRVTAIPRGQGVTSRVTERREPVQIADITIKGSYESPIRQPLIEAGHRALLGVPLLSENEVIGVLAVTRKRAGEFEPEIVRVLSTFATQSALAIQNARLFREIEDKSRQLEAASQHKSEFLANMSHELRTPLNAILGFSEVLAAGMFGGINEKQAEYLRDILESGRHLLSLINDILDLSKIEAGRMELEPADFDLPGAIDNALILVRERATRRGIALGQAIDDRVGVTQGDERKVKQVLLNLLSNALKFTPEGGRIDVQASVNENMVEVSVTDTGVGIAPDDQEAVFEEFRQVGAADKKVEGTGLGLALSRKFIELHGGRISVKSQVGQGSTFTFTLPVRRQD